MTDRLCAVALAMLCGVSACSAQPAPGQDDRQSIVVPFHFSPDAKNPMEVFRLFHFELGERAAREARDRDYEPVVSRDQLLDGRWTLMSAITPRRGVFYWVLSGPYGVYGKNTMLEARRDLRVCRFTLSFDGPSADPLIPTHSWLALVRPDSPQALIEPTCAPPLQTEIERIARWRNDRSKAVYTVLGEARSDKLRGWLVDQSKVNHPFDASGAVAALIERGDTVVRATPAGSYDTPISYVTTRSGRTMVGFHDSSASTLSHPACIVDGVTWRDVASGAGTPSPVPSPVMASARQLCEQITQRYNEQVSERMDRELKTNPITVAPVTVPPQRADEK